MMAYSIDGAAMHRGGFIFLFYHILQVKQKASPKGTVFFACFPRMIRAVILQI